MPDTYRQEQRWFKAWLRKQKLNAMQELLAIVLFSECGFQAARKFAAHCQDWREEATTDPTPASQ